MLYVPAEFRQQRIVVLGDTMIDKSIKSGRSYHNQSEGLVVISTYSEANFPGGAGNIAANISSLGGQAVHLGVVGDDNDAAELRSALQSRGVRSSFVVDPTRPTTRKLRIYVDGRPIVRIDTESTEPIGAQIERTLLSECFRELAEASALVVSDYRKGVVTPSLAKMLVARARSLAIPTIIDSKSRHIRHFAGCAVFKANRQELEAVLQREIPSDNEAVAAARSISAVLGGAVVIVTDGERGIVQVDSDGNYHHATPSQGKAVRSVTGAGDTVAACVALGCSAGMHITDGVDLALRAATEAVTNLDTTAVLGHIKAGE